MFTLTTLIALALIAFAAGFISSRIISRNSDSQKKNEALQTELEETKNTLAKYQQSVSQHFLSTSEKVGELTQSYINLHEQLAKGASELANSEITPNALEEYKTATLISPEEAYESESIQEEKENTQTNQEQSESPASSTEQVKTPTSSAY